MKIAWFAVLSLLLALAAFGLAVAGGASYNAYYLATAGVFALVAVAFSVLSLKE